MPVSTAPSPSRRLLSTLGWAAYLACSWTWCIGMFLPVLLVRDYGIWGFLVFAIPNVVGAAAMGWMLTRQSSAVVADAHRAACAAFSIVTVAFQIAFLATMLPRLADLLPDQPVQRTSALAVGLAGTVATITAAAGFARRASALLIWIASAAALGVVLARAGWPEIPHRGERRGADLVALAPVVAFGFLLCPYLDLTFHRARQESDRDGRLAFGVGFGLLFPLMILGTLLYFAPAMSWLRERRAPELALAVPLGVHLLGQLAVTVAYHARGFEEAFAHHRPRPARLIGMGAALVLLVAAVTGVRLDAFGTALTAPEVVYRLFMSFYGLIFPAYVWLCMVPARGEGGSRPPTLAKLGILGVACLLAAPCYWMGFIERQTLWLLPGLGVLLIARLFIPPSRSETC